MMRKMIVTGVAAFAATAAALAATGDQMAGQWQSTVTDMSGGAPRVRTSMTCIGLGASLLAQFRQQRPNDCHATREVVAGGRIDIATVCSNGSSTMTGAYTPTTMNLAWRGTARLGGKTLPINTRISSRRVGATCTEDE